MNQSEPQNVPLPLPLPLLMPLPLPLPLPLALPLPVPLPLPLLLPLWVVPPPLPLPLPHHVGIMDVVCGHCSAKFFRLEPHFCCANGAVDLPLWRTPPEPLLSLLSNNEFRLKIRGYNCAMSLGSSVFDDLTVDRGPATFKMAGRSWRLLPRAIQPGLIHNEHKTAQVYTLPTNDATDRRIVLTSTQQRSQLRRDWLQSLHVMLMEHNALVQSFVQSNANEVDWTITIGTINPHATANNDTMVGLLVNGGCPHHTTVIPLCGDGSLVIVPDLDPYYQPIHFVLLFPWGDPQWGLHLNRIKNDNRRRTREGTPLSIFDYLKFNVQRRGNVSDVSMHTYGRLFEEWVVDCFLQAENLKLKYLRRNQGKFRTERYSSVVRQIRDTVPTRQIGSPATHLPSSFVRGGRYFRELYADAMCLPAKYGGIDYFVTFTTNPSWPEIVENASISNGMNSPDLYVRVFHLKMRALLTDIIVHGVLGVVIAYTWAVEFQQRGLPHLHALFIVRPQDKPHSIEVIDNVVSAQLPDAALDPVYYAMVTNHMMHGPCGILNPNHYCMKDGQCRFDYPKRLQQCTTIPADGYTNLARPIGPNVEMSDHFIADNSWVVPHNKYLLCKYNAHINVECSASVQVVKYLYSYVYKGSQSTSAAVRDEDEIKQFSEGRITSTAEALWQLFGLESHRQKPNVQRLGCFVPADPMVQFDPDLLPDAILNHIEDAVDNVSHLSAWFRLNAVDPFARTLRYVEIPEHYVWNLTDRKWTRRTRGHCIGRLYPVHPTNREPWALRLLLLSAKGCLCETDIRTIDGECFLTYVEAATAAGLLTDDTEYIACLQRTAQFASPIKLRELFLIIITKGQPSDPMHLFNMFFDDLTDDYQGSPEQCTLRLLHYITNYSDQTLDALGIDDIGIPINQNFLETFVSNPLDLHVDIILNPAQQFAHDAIIADIENVHRGGIFTLLASAGTGKTLLINTLLHTARQRNMRVAACATSALAASLLGHARTAHAMFKLSISIDENSTCKPSASYKAWLRTISCFIWDEISMAHRWAIDAVDRLLRDIHEIDLPFGGVTVVLAGDMRQLLPVHRFARDPSLYCVNLCTWFQTAIQLALTDNMRAAEDPLWAGLLELVGRGDDVIFPSHCVVKDLDALIAAVWPNDNYCVDDNRSVVTMTREDATMINGLILHKFPGVSGVCIVYSLIVRVVIISVDMALSCDLALDCEESLYPIEFVHACSVSGLPEHCIILKKCAPYMIMHNVNAKLCNGTRVKYLRRIGKTLEVEILTGVHRGDDFCCTHVCVTHDCTLNRVTR